MLSVDYFVSIFPALILLIGTKESTATVCPSGTFQFEGLCYKYHTDVKNWRDAHNYCQATDHGQLAIVRTNTFFQMLQRFYSDHGSNTFWIGAYDPHRNRQFQWVDGASCCNHWLPGEPNNAHHNEYCVNFYSSGYNDLNCRDGLRFLCQTYSCKRINNCVSDQEVCTGIDQGHHRCDQCHTGYYEAGWGQGCQACYGDPHCMDGYLQCSGPLQADQTCTKCKAGYYIDNVQNTCQECQQIPHCVQHVCTNASSSVCLACDQSSILINNGSTCFDYEIPERVRCDKNCTVTFGQVVTWNVAKTVCEKRNGHLYVPEDYSEDLRIRNYMSALFSGTYQRNELWIGGQLLIDNSIMWLNNLTSSANSWSFPRPKPTTEPLCIALDPKDNFLWTAHTCDSYKPFVCEERVVFTGIPVG